MLNIEGTHNQHRNSISLNPDINSNHEIFGPTSPRAIYNARLEDPHFVVGATYQRPELKGEYDHPHFKQLLEQSERFGRLRPEAALKLLGDRRKYTYLKKFAVQRLDEKICKELQILYQIGKCENSVREPDEQLSHSIFSWSLKDFLKRRQLKDFVWVDVMQRTSEDCLNVFKFKQDVEQLQKFLRRIFNGLYSNMSSEDIDIYESVVKPINNAKKVLQIAKHIEQELKDNTRLLWELSQKDTFLANVRRESMDKMMKIYLETRLMNSHIWNPIELRYQLNWYQTKVNQLRYGIDKQQEMRHNDIAKYRQKCDVETRVSASCMDYYYTAIEAMKSRIVMLQTKLDNDYEIIENRIAYKKSRIEKIREEWTFRKEEIQRFREEIELVRMRQEQEKEEEMEKKRLEEEALALKKLKKVDKGKKGKANLAKGKGAVKSGGPTKGKVAAKAAK